MRPNADRRAQTKSPPPKRMDQTKFAASLAETTVLARKSMIGLLVNAAMATCATASQHGWDNAELKLDLWCFKPEDLSQVIGELQLKGLTVDTRPVGHTSATHLIMTWEGLCQTVDASK